MFPTFLEDFSAFWHKVSQADFVLCLTSPLNQPFLQEATASFSWECAVCLVTQLHLTLCDSMHCSLPGSSLHGDSPSKNTRVGCHALSRGSSHPSDWTHVSLIVGRFFTVWATREAQISSINKSVSPRVARVGYCSQPKKHDRYNKEAIVQL